MFYFVTSGDCVVCSFLQLYHNEPCSTADNQTQFSYNRMKQLQYNKYTDNIIELL